MLVIPLCLVSVFQPQSAGECAQTSVLTFHTCSMVDNVKVKTVKLTASVIVSD